MVLTNFYFFDCFQFQEQMTDHVSKLCQAAIVLQEFNATNEAKMELPHGVLWGMQSAGKTRYLSMCAGRKIGGAEKKETGTRCSVVYQFETSRREECRCGPRLGAMKDVNARDVHLYVTRHMESLGDTFSEDPYYVMIKGPRTLNFVITDLPGLKPGNPPAN